MGFVGFRARHAVEIPREAGVAWIMSAKIGVYVAFLKGYFGDPAEKRCLSGFTATGCEDDLLFLASKIDALLNLRLRLGLGS